MALAKAITLVESTVPSHKKEADLLLTHLLQKQNDCFRLGITGPPGAGKSSFIEALGKYILNDLPSKKDNTNSVFLPSSLAVLCIITHHCLLQAVLFWEIRHGRLNCLGTRKSLSDRLLMAEPLEAYLLSHTVLFLFAPLVGLSGKLMSQVMDWVFTISELQ